MLVLGYVIQNVSSPGRKLHSAFAIGGGGGYVAAFGPEGSAGQVRPAALAPRDAATKVAQLLSEKKNGGYTTVHVPLVVAEVPDDTAHQDLRSAIESAYAAGLATEPTSPGAAIEQFVATSGAAAPTPPAAPAARRVADRDEGFRLPPDEVVTRPNGEVYVPRALGAHTDIAALRALRDSMIFALLEGLPGTGKTAVADAAFPDLILVQCHGDMTVAHLVGSHQPTKDGGWRWEFGPLAVAALEGRPVLFDEVHKMPDEVGAVLHGLMDGRRVLVIDDRPDLDPIIAADGFYVIGAYNPETLGGKGLTEALLSRFSVQIEVTTDHAAARSLGVPEGFVTIAENLTTRAREAVAAGGSAVWAPQMRELLAAKRLIDAGMGETFAAGALIAQCPWPEDRGTVAAVVASVLGVDAEPLRLGAQV